jgi:hypothetical protein
MNCVEAKLYVSAVYDGEHVPVAAAQHIGGCKECRRVLNDYLRMGAGMRLVANSIGEALPPLQLQRRGRPFGFLWRRVAVPRLALAGLVAGLVVAVTMVSIVRAQTRPLWFQFGYGFEKGRPPFNYMVAKQGYDELTVTSAVSSGGVTTAALRVQVESISDDDVVLRCRAMASGLEGNGPERKLARVEKKQMPLDRAPVVHYKPGDSLAIPIEGGRTIYLKGEVLDHQPKIAFGYPLEPPVDKLVVRSPVLTSGDRTIADLDGATVTADEKTPTMTLRTPEGSFLFRLRPFPGAVRGEADWGEIHFRLNERKYRLLAAAPVTGGEQPQTVWVRYDADAVGGVALGAEQLPQ